MMETCTHVLRMALSCYDKQSFKKFLDPDSGPDHYKIESPGPCPVNISQKFHPHSSIIFQVNCEQNNK